LIDESESHVGGVAVTVVAVGGAVVVGFTQSCVQQPVLTVIKPFSHGAGKAHLTKRQSPHFCGPSNHEQPVDVQCFELVQSLHCGGAVVAGGAVVVGFTQSCVQQPVLTAIKPLPHGAGVAHLT